MNFTFQTTGKIICKNGAVNDLVPEIKKHSLQRVQFVVDPFWKDSELLNSLEEMLNRAGISSYVFSNIEPDPSYQTVEELVSEIKT